MMYLLISSLIKKIPISQFGFNLINNPKRVLMKEATLKMSYNNEKKTQQHLWLFDDLILVATPMKNKRYTFLFFTYLTDCFVWEIKDSSGELIIRVRIIVIYNLYNLF